MTPRLCPFSFSAGVNDLWSMFQDERNSGDYERIGQIPKCSRYRRIHHHHDDDQYAEQFDSDATDYENLHSTSGSSDDDYEVCEIQPSAVVPDAVRTLDVVFR